MIYSPSPLAIGVFAFFVLVVLGIDHTKLTFKFQGRYYRLTDVHGKVVEEVLG